MIVNIVDFREDRFDTTICALFEPAYLDNNKGYSQYIDDCEKYDETNLTIEKISIVQALEYGTNLNGSFTLFIYNVGQIYLGD